jgi:hypothetical protein
MASITRPAPRIANLRTCLRCGAPPQLFRAERGGKDLWCISCPDCALMVGGRRVEGLALGGQNLVEVTKPGDMFDEIIEKWNNLTTADLK